ncbi:MAG: MMPL family transporter [Polyangiales bacterium]
MFLRWGRYLYPRRVAVLWLSALSLLVAALVLARGAPLVTGNVRGIESDDAAALVERELRAPEISGFTVLFSHPTLTASDDAFRDAATRALAPLRRHPDVLAVQTPFDDDVSMFIAPTLLSLDEHRAIARVTLRHGVADDTRRWPALRALLRSDTLTVRTTGYAAFKGDLDRVMQRDLIRAEVLSAPFTVAVLLLVFGSLVAATLPWASGISVAAGVAAVFLLARRMEVAQYAVNVASLVGTGVAIDYSLFMVTRFREELAGGRDVDEAIAVTVATAGRAVAFSGLAVAIGLGGLLFFHGSYIASLGLGAMLVVVFAVLYALTFMPALLAVLGRRVDAGRLFKPGAGGSGFWRRMAHRVMRRPVLVLALSLVALVAAGSPFLRLNIAVPDVRLLPPDVEAHATLTELEAHLPDRAATRIAVVARFPGAPLATPARVGALYDLSRRIAAIPGVTSVQSVTDVVPMLDRDGYVALYRGAPSELGEASVAIARETVGPTIAVLAVTTEHLPTTPAARQIVRAIRARRDVADGTILVTGQTALDLDTASFIRARAPAAIGFVVGMTLLVLFLLLGSVLLPFKAVLMNFLSITASFGALVWIFQEGHLSWLLRFRPAPTEPSLPLLMFCIVFGLSMDYEVLLLTRMQEEYERTRDNRAAVAEGLERSAKLITSAAAIMVVVFSAFVFARIILLKAVGLGMAIAVALDATIVRLLVVPATMQLFGDLNWWAPKRLQRIAKRLSGGGH